MTSIRNIHQMLVNAGPGNSISQGARLLRTALQSWGYKAELYAETVSPATVWEDVTHFRRYRPTPEDLLVVHYTQASPLIDYVATLNVPVVLVYHNITPPHFFVGVNSRLLEATQQGYAQLPLLCSQTVCAVADSAFNVQDLKTAGYEHTEIVPVIIPETLSRITPDPQILQQLKNDVNLLCVGRIAPNKRFEDVIKVLFYYRQIESRARLILVGSGRNTAPYLAWLQHFITWLGLDDAVTFTGHISDAALAAYYQGANALVYMSEHEGFGIPLVESMRFDLPIVAYASSAIPETLGDAGILVTEKNYPVIAEILHLLQTDATLRERLIAQQRVRVQTFSPEQVLARFQTVLKQVVVDLEAQP